MYQASVFITSEFGDGAMRNDLRELDYMRFGGLILAEKAARKTKLPIHIDMSIGHIHQGVLPDKKVEALHLVPFFSYGFKVMSITENAMNDSSLGFSFLRLPFR